MNIPQHIIDEATKRGIVPGARIKCAVDEDPGTVGPIDEWHYYGDGYEDGGPKFGDLTVGDNDGGSSLHAISKGAWAVVTHSVIVEKLENGVATICGPYMKEAIIARAEELNVPMLFQASTAKLLPDLAFVNNRLEQYRGSDDFDGNPPPGTKFWKASEEVSNHEFLRRLEGNARLKTLTLDKAKELLKHSIHVCTEGTGREEDAYVSELGKYGIKG